MSSSTPISREWLVTAFACSMLLVIFALRTVVGVASDFQGLPLIIPIALVAMEFGRRGGFVMAVLSCFVIFLSSFVGGPVFNPVEFLIPAVCFMAIALIIGDLATRRRRADEENSRWFELSIDMHATISPQGWFTRLNPAWERTLGRSQEDLMSLPYYDLVHPDDRAAAIAVRDSLANGTELQGFENRFQAEDGEWRWLLWSARSDGRQVYAVAKDITERKALELERERMLQRAEGIARTDPLTGLANRRAWDEELRSEVARSRRRSSPLAMIIIDLDRFKLLNDTAGHQAGDSLLQELSLTWRLELRTGDTAARIGGDEFAILLPDCPLGFAEGLLTRMRNVTPTEASWSAGVAYQDGGESAESMTARADEALYAAKALGGNESVTSPGAGRPQTPASPYLGKPEQPASGGPGEP